MTNPRSEVISKDVDGSYHIISRCVRRAFLCGSDPYSGKNYEHRRAWVYNRVKYLLELFTLEAYAISIMHTHYHLNLRTRYALAQQLTPEEVARRWLLVNPKKRHQGPAGEQILQEDIQELVANPKRIKTLRKRLSSVSWFMKALNEYISRLANKEDNCKGAFWEGRFKAIALQDEIAITSCMLYIDLNPIRAGIADTPEDSIFTSAFDRIKALQAMQLLAKPKLSLPEHQRKTLRKQYLADHYLAPIDARENHRGILHMSLTSYLDLLDWSGRIIKKGKLGSIPKNLKPILDRLKLSPDSLLHLLSAQQTGFSRIIAPPETIIEKAHSIGRKWIKGITLSRKIYQFA